MTLQDWLKSRHLTKHTTSPQEIQDLTQGAIQNLADSRVSGLSAGGRFNFAYNAALKMATAALAASGYRASRDQHHFRVIQSLRFTICADSNMVDLLDRFRKKRNVSIYERPGTISDHEADEMAELAEKLRAMVEVWLKEGFPELL
ncbi:MAG: DNA-binding protein [Candidatus Eisenbacteria bacterium]